MDIPYYAIDLAFVIVPIVKKSHNNNDRVEIAYHMLCLN